MEIEIETSATPAVTTNSHPSPSSESKPPEQNVQQLSKPDPELLAKADYAQLVKFEGIAETDISGRVAAVTAFLKEHGQSSYSYPARALLDELKRIPALPSAPVTPVTQTPAEAPKPIIPENPTGEVWRDLFDGASLDGWQFNSGKWGVLDGAIVNFSTAANGARIETIAAFDDFEFTCEIQNSARYAVIQLRDTGISFKLKVRDAAWDSLVVKAMGASVQCSLNGAVLAPSDDADDNNGGLSGKIAFYTRTGTTLKLRNIKLRRIQHK